MGNDDSGIDVDEWIEMSRKGALCAIFGCINEPTSQCQFCFKYYCYEDIKNHYHDLLE